MNDKILIVDDEPGILNLLKDYFEVNSYLVFTARNGLQALEKASQNPDLILLDVNMPDMDGMEVCAKIRSHVTCPILFLTARIEDADKVKGFSVGGDDYIVKPFSIDELGARVAAHLRRERRTVGKNSVSFHGDLAIDYGERTIYVNNVPVPLAKKEFDIVELLSMNAGQVFDKERIYERLWDWDSEGDSAVVAEHIRRIRAKMAVKSAKPCIETVWGVGYKWVK